MESYDHVDFGHRSGMHFTFHAILNYLIAAAALTGMYFISYVWPFYLAFFIGAWGLMLHELGHKTMAWWRGVKGSHFVLTPLGIVIGYTTAILIGVPFTVAGGVAIPEGTSTENRVFVASAGPLTNILQFAVYTVIHLVYPVIIPVAGVSGGIPLFEAMAFTNLYLGTFNFFPIPGFDGYHIFDDAPWLWASIFSAILGVGAVVVFATNTVDAVLPMYQASRGGLIGFGIGGSIATLSNVMLTRSRAIELPKWVAYSVLDRL